jgi:SAM-dependent methyltransferase
MEEETDSSWRAYYEKIFGRPVNAFYRNAVIRFDQPGHAVDLGFGAGIETRDMLDRGWKVSAIDKEQSAIDFILERVPPDQMPSLRTDVSAFESLNLPKADFVWAGLSLPFCAPEAFDTVWSKIIAALKPGGRFAGDFFGVRHAWSGNTDMTFHTREQVEALAEQLQLEYIQEGEGERQTAFDGYQKWHMISVLARKEE